MFRAALVTSLVFATTTAVADRAAEPLPAAGKAGPSEAPMPAQQAQGARASISAVPVMPPKPAMPPPNAPAEVGVLGKKLAGSYGCKGVAFVGNGSSIPLRAKVAIKLDLDNAWLTATMTETTDGQGGMKWSEYRTFDPIAKQWTRIQLTNAASHVMSSSLGERDGAWTWEGVATSQAGTQQIRDHEQWSGKQVKMWGELLASGSWSKSYEVTCSR